MPEAYPYPIGPIVLQESKSHLYPEKRGDLASHRSDYFRRVSRSWLVSTRNTARVEAAPTASFA